MRTMAELFEHAKNNNGLVPIKCETKTYYEKSRALYKFFTFQIKQNAYLITKLENSPNNTKQLNKSWIDIINFLIFTEDEHFIYLNVYALFGLSGDDQTNENLKPFEVFYERLHEEALKHYDELFFRFLYEVSPMRVKPYGGIGCEKSDQVSEDKELTQFAEDLMETYPHFKHWTQNIAKYLKTLGRWTQITIGCDGLLSREDEARLLKEKYDI